MELELRHLKTVRTIAEAGSLTRAASLLGLAQPALSAQLRRIERALGGALFERGRHGVRATALGELVLERARLVLPAVSGLQQEAVRFARAQAGREGGPLRLGGTHGPLLGALVDRLAAVLPQARVTTHASWSERELTALLGEGRLDYVLTGVCGTATPPDTGQPAWEEFAVDPVFVMLADGHPLAGAREVDLAELADEEWTCVPGDGCFADCFTAACARAGFAPRRMYETDVASCAHLVQVGRAVGLCRATFPATPGIATRPLAGTPLLWRHLLGRPPATPLAGTAATVLAEARAAHAQAAARNDSYADWLARRGGPARRLTPPGSSPVPDPALNDTGRGVHAPWTGLP
ncbi:LysR family transcriptional regulator [Streptomyces mexicanus]|uniref:LysR family transcriptional regulator n=1 Tax=Streptomyces mexicanus TaxID=178566 RepID=UPI003647EFD3